MLFANVCELTRGSPGPVCSMRHKRIPGRRSQGREQSEHLSRRPRFGRAGVLFLDRKGLVVGSIGIVLGLVGLSMSNAVAARIDFSKPLVVGYAAGDDWGPEGAADGRRQGRLA